MDFEYFMPAHLYFGRGKVNQIGEICTSIGKKALIVTGRNSTRKNRIIGPRDIKFAQFRN